MRKKKWMWIPASLILLVLSACTAAEQESGSGERDTVVVEDAGQPEDEDGKDAMTNQDGKMAGETAKENDGDAGENIEKDEAADGSSMAAGESSGEDEAASAYGNPLQKERRHAESGMKLSILGDSISTFEGWIPEGNSDFYPQNGAVQDVSQTWWKIVLDEAGLTLCANGSSSGSACFGYSQEEDPMFGCSDYRIAQLAGADGSVPDIIIVYMGTNDVLMSASVGDNDGLRTVEEGMVGSFSDGYTMILDKLERQYPDAQIYCCTLLPMGDWGTDQPFVPFVNGQNLTSKEYADQIRTIAQNRGIPVIDLYNCGITIDNMSEMTSDGVHLTPEGMRRVADTVLKCIM